MSASVACMMKAAVGLAAARTLVGADVVERLTVTAPQHIREDAPGSLACMMKVAVGLAAACTLVGANVVERLTVTAPRHNFEDARAHQVWP